MSEELGYCSGPSKRPRRREHGSVRFIDLTVNKDTTYGNNLKLLPFLRESFSLPTSPQ